MLKLAGVLTRRHAASNMTNYIIKKHTSQRPGQPKRYGVIKLAQDVHAHFIVSSVQEEGKPPQAPRKRDILSHLHWVEELVDQSEKVHSCYEAGPTGFSLHRQLTKLGVENIVIAPTRLDERGKGVNNDASDTLQLAVRLDRYVAGNKRVFSVLRVPTVGEEERRMWPRQRKQLVEQRLSFAAQGRSLALTQGVPVSNMWWKEANWKQHKEKLGANLVAHLEIFRDLILGVDGKITEIDERILAARQTRKEAKPKYAGDTTMEFIDAEVCDWKRFNSWRKAGSYCGLTGGVSASGQSHCDLSITKAGNRRLRTALVEMAWRMARHQKNYWLTKKWAKVLGAEAKAHRRNRKKAIVAYARALFVDLWKWKTGRVTAESLGWEMC
jgi:transposase